MNVYKKRLKKVWLWLRIRQVRGKRWWWQNDRRYGWAWRAGNGAAAVFLLAVAAMPVVQHLVQARGYTLDADALQLVGSTDPTLTRQLTYNAQTQTYQFNKAAIVDAPAEVAAALQAQIGTASGQGKDKSLYALDVPQSISKGVTYHDVNTQLKFSLVPEFTAAPGQVVQGHLVFPLSDDAQAVYTLKNNGLKEDIVVPHAAADTMTFSYRLDLPDTLEVRAIPDSGGAIGVYSADPTLYNNITFGSDADRATVQKARRDGAKTNLVFGLPSPVIKDVHGNDVGSARFELHGNELSVVATGLQDVDGPVAIDPSVVVTSTSDFQTGNNEGNITFGTANQVTSGNLTGGTISAGWTSPGNSFTTARYGAATVAYNDHLYVIGGCGTQTSLTACNSNYLSDIQYIAINPSTGALTGSWASAGSSLGSGRFGLSAVVYNGYLYVIGGYNGTTYASDVQSIAINPSTGALTGSWNTSAGSFTGGRYLGAAVAYNNYLYVLGGYNGSTYYATTQYAMFNADGTVGSFTNSTNSYSTGRFGLSAVVYNGFLYVLGGCSAGTCTTYKNDIQYAAIASDGSLGSFATGPNFTTARFGQSAVVYNGYIYVMGGYSGSYQTDSQYAPLYANGTVGSFATANSSGALPAVAEGASTAYNGKLYVVGGSVSGTPQSSSRYAAVDAVGWLNPFQNNLTNFGTGIAVSCAVAYKGYVYKMGGSTSDGTTQNIVSTVESIAINTDGTFSGSWTTTGVTQLPEFRGSMGCVAFKDHIYMMGGYVTGAGSGTGTARYAAVSGGTVGTWNSLPTLLSTPIRPYAYVYGNSNGTYLYAIGGSNSRSSNEDGMEYIKLNDSTGAADDTTWHNVATNESVNVNNRTQVAVGNHVYSFGAGQATIYATIQSDGDVTSWSTTAATISDTFIGATAVNGCIYLMGGENSGGTTNLATVRYGCPASNGTISAWTTAPSLATPTTDMAVTSYNGFIYGVGGCAPASSCSTVRTTEFTYVNNGGSGQIGSWSTTGSAIGALSGEQNSTTVYNGYMYIQSADTGGSGANDVWYAKLNADGTVGTWTQAASTSSVYTQTNHMVACAGYMYSISGNDGSSFNTGTEYALINSDGSLGTWQTATATLTTARGYAATACYNNRVYFYGGNDGTDDSAEVDYAQPSGSGDITAWTVEGTNPLPYDVAAPGGLAYNGYLYAFGGIDLDNTGDYYNTVVYAPINSNGSLGTWAYTTPLDTAQNPQIAAYNGFVYAVNGWNGSCTNTSAFASIMGNGALSAWQAGTSPGSTNCDMTSVANGYIYNAATSSGFEGRLSYAPLSSITRAGHYSKLIDFGAAVNVTSVTYFTGTAQSAIMTVNYQSAGTAGMFGSLAATSSIAGAGGCFGTTANTRYLWLSITIDDSLGQGTDGVFPDANDTNGYITEVDASYTTLHPSTDIRMRGGKTLQNGNVSALDTCS